MDEGVVESCGFCGKQFRLRPDQMNREVQCPHCKAITKPLALAVTPGADIFGGPRPHTPRRAPARLPYQVALAKSGARKNTFAIVWIILLVLASAGLAVLVKVMIDQRESLTPPPPVKAPIVVAVQAPLSTPDPDKTTTAAASGKAALKPAGKTSATAAADTAKAAKDAADVEVDGTVDIGVFKLHSPGDRLGLAAGKLVNHTGKVIKVLRIIVPINSKEGVEIGKATAVILNIPRGATIPFVAEWEHGESEFGVLARGGATYSIGDAGDPLGGMPEVLTENAYPSPDRNSITASGEVHLFVTNKGQTDLRDIEVSALLLDEKGNVAGAAKGRVVLPKSTTALKPAQSVECSIPWNNCTENLVRSVEVWAQPTAR
jgi:hypothetical protein